MTSSPSISKHSLESIIQSTLKSEGGGCTNQLRSNKGTQISGVAHSPRAVEGMLVNCIWWLIDFSMWLSSG